MLFSKIDLKELRPEAKRIYVFIFLIICLTTLQMSQVTAESKKPNILLITIDTLRADRLSCYGSSRPLTPNIDRLAKRGIVFSYAFAHTPTTLPSHTNILLGTTPPFHGVHDNLNFVVAEDFLTLAEFLQRAGYKTGAFVGSYLLDRRFGLNQGFEVYDDNYARSHKHKLANLERRAEEVVKPALDWLQKQSSPWFLWLHCYDPHDPYEPPPPFDSMYAEDPYNGEVAYVDYALKPLIDFVETPPYQSSTIIIFTGDHGESLGEHEEETHGFLAYNSTLRVPLIIALPGVKPAIIDEPVCHLDLFPTIAELINLSVPEGLQGISLVPVFRGKKLPDRKIYFESLYPYYNRGWAPIRGFYEKNLKFIDSPLPELYDWRRDLAEKNNLIRSGLVQKYKAELASLLTTLSGASEKIAQARVDRERLEKLRSLGYVSSQPVVRREVFGPEYDVKNLLPYNNQAVKAMNLYYQGEKQRAIQLLEDIIKKCPLLDSAYSNLAIIYQKESNFNKAMEILKLALANLPSSYEFFFNHLNLLIEARRFDEAIKFFEENGPRYPHSAGDPEALNLVGLAYNQIGNPRKAIEIFELAASLDDRQAALMANFGSAYLSLFLKTKERRALEASMEKFKKAIEIDPEFSQAYHGLGMAYRLIGNIEGAIYCWEKAAELNPDWPQIYYYLGLAQMEKSEFQKALSLFRKYLERAGSALSREEKEKISAFIQACEERIKK